MVKIVLFVPYLYNGGAERVCSIWANNLSEIYDVTILVYRRLENEYFVNSRVKIECLNEYDFGNCSFLKKIKILKKYLKENRIDIIIPFMPTQSLYSHFASCFLKTKVIHNIRCNPYSDPSNLFKRFIRDYCIKRDKLLIVQNEEQLAYFNKFNITKKVIYNPINSKIIKEDFNYRGFLKKVILVGRLDQQKNYYMLFDAILELNKKGIKDIVFDIYGDGEQKNELNDYIKNNNLENARLMGNSSDIFNIEKKYDLYIMCSNYEGFPNALLEAMAIGLPVISTSCPTGPSSMINNKETGILVDVNNSIMLANEIENLYKNPELLKEYGKKGQNSVFEKYNSLSVKEKLLAFIKEVTEKC